MSFCFSFSLVFWCTLINVYFATFNPFLKQKNNQIKYYSGSCHLPIIIYIYFLNTFNIKLSSYSPLSLLGNNGEICTIITSFFGDLTVLFSLHVKWIDCLSQKLWSSVEIRQHINFPKNIYQSNCPKCSKLRHIVGLKDNFQSHINVFLYYFRVMIH